MSVNNLSLHNSFLVGGKDANSFSATSLNSFLLDVGNILPGFSFIDLSNLSL